MIDLKTIKNITIAEGSVKKITNSSGVVLWEVKDTGSSASIDIDLNNQWIASTKTLDGYKVYMSNSNHNVDNGYASMKFIFKGMPDFKLWINSYAESLFDYTIAWDMDKDYPTSNPSYNSTGVKAHTNGNQKDPTSISNFTEVDYPNDGGEHFVVVTFRKDGSGSDYDDRGYVAVKLTLISTTWVVSSTEFVKKDGKYYEKLTEVGTYEGGVTANTGNYKEGNELTVTTKQAPANDYIIVGSNKYYKICKYVTINGKEVDTGEYTQGDLIGTISNTMKVKYVDGTIKEFTGLTNIQVTTDSNRLNSKEVQISEGITSIGDWVFGRDEYNYSRYQPCTSLTSVTIPESVTSIGAGAFDGCSSLTGITIPTGVTNIGDYAFASCTSITSITIPNSLTTINRGVFQGMSLTSITIPKNITSIGGWAFNECKNLSSVTIENSASKLTYNIYAFANISSSAKLYVPAKLLSQYQQDSNWTSAFGGGISAIETLISTTWVVSSTEFVKKDGKYYEKINEVETYEGGVTANTGNYKEGNELTVTYKQGSADDYIVTDGKKYYKNYIYVTPKDQEINTGDYIQGDYIGEATPSMKVTYVDNTEKTFYDLTTIDQNTDANKRNAKEVIIYDGVTEIGLDAFRDCTSLTSVTLPDSVTRIGDSAFGDCTYLTNVTLPSNLTSIGQWAFGGCRSFTSITIPNSLTSINNYSFQYCTAVTTVMISSSVTSIGNSAFYNCNSLTTVTIQNSTSKLYYRRNAFGGISSTAKLYVPSNLLSDYQSDSNWTSAFGGGIYEIPS